MSILIPDWVAILALAKRGDGTAGGFATAWMRKA